MLWLKLILEFIVGCAVLTWSASLFIKGSVWVATFYRVPPMVVGMVLIGFGTSCPELVVAITASVHHSSGIAIGSVVGSNIANIALVGGMAAMLIPLTMRSQLIFFEFPGLVLVTIIVGVMFYVGHLGRIDGIILLVMLALYLYYMYRLIKRSSTDDSLLQESANEASQETSKSAMRATGAIVSLVVGLLLLLVSAELMVGSASQMASLLGLSNLVIGLTIVAVGTSLPELAATVISCLRGEADLAIGNVVGSCVFNLLAVLAMPALIHPAALSVALLRRDFPALLVVTCAFWLLAILPPTRHQLGRLGGSILLLLYVLYIFIVVWTAFA